jgi:hypothetical protein
MTSKRMMRTKRMRTTMETKMTKTRMRMNNGRATTNQWMGRQKAVYWIFN